MSLGLCFPTSAQYWQNSSAPIAIGNLSQSNSSEFITYLHFEPELEVCFLELICANGARIRISGEHLIFKDVGDSSIATAAKNIQIGDKLIYKDQPIEVIEIGERIETGAFAPMTKSGTLIVDGFLVSCYAHVKSHEFAHKALAPLRLWYRKMGKLSFYQKSQAKKQPSSGVHKYAKTLSGIRSIVPIA